MSEHQPDAKSDAAPADDRDPREVSRHELVAERMPSVLTQLRPMDGSSTALLRFLKSRTP